MSQPAVKALDLPFELVFDDGEPLEDDRHFIQANLLIDLIRQVMKERGRTEFFTAGDNFVYYSVEQAWDVARKVAKGRTRQYFRGPDVYFVEGVEGRRPRKGWVSWEEGDRLPDLIVELLSPSTEKIDRTEKMDLYARVFRTRDYFLYDFDTAVLEGFRLVDNSYRPMAPDSQGRFRSEVLGLDLGLWPGVLRSQEATWIRLFDPDGRMIPAPLELAEAEHQRAEAEYQRAEAERQRADAAEAELARLRARLG